MKPFLFRVSISLSAFLFLNSPGTAFADQKADALLKQVEAKARTIQTLTAEVQETRTTSNNKMQSKGTVRLMKPNLYRIQMSGGAEEFYASDGSTAWRKNTDSPYSKRSLSKGDSGLTFFPLNYYLLATLPYIGGMGSTKTVYLGQKTEKARVLDLVEIQRGKPGINYLYRLYIGQDKLIHRAVTVMNHGGVSQTDVRLTNIRLNPNLSDAKVAFTAEEVERYSKPAPRFKDYAAPPLLALGQQAPEFTLPTPDGIPVSLNEFIQGKKAVVLNFWFYH